MGFLDRLVALEHQRVHGEGWTEEDFTRLLASVTPLDLRDQVLITDWREVVDMICQRVPGYGPH